MKNLDLKGSYEKLLKLRALKNFQAITHTLGGILFGSSKVTHGAPHILDFL